METYVIFLLILNGIMILVPNELEYTSTQTSRILNVALFLPLYGRVLGWW